jgi:Na+-transporting methylmalonyl-CoA/oxaloacetate decarboxylase gamma subunit
MNNMETVIISVLLVLFILGCSIIFVDQVEKRTMKKREKEEFDEDHALDMAMNKMLEDFSEEEIQDLIDESKSKDPKDEV